MSLILTTYLPLTALDDTVTGVLLVRSVPARPDLCVLEWRGDMAPRGLVSLAALRRALETVAAYGQNEEER